MSIVTSRELTHDASFELVGNNLGRDIKRSIQFGLRSATVFDGERRALSVFRSCLASALVDRQRVLEQLMLPFLSTGNSEPSNMVFDKSVRFAIARPIAAIQGCLGELLAIDPVCRLVSQLCRDEFLPSDTSIFVGDSIRVGGRKSADMHLIGRKSSREARLYGVVEIKSYACSDDKLSLQFAKHCARATTREASVHLCSKTPKKLRMQIDAPPFWIAVLPSAARLSRAYKIALADGRTFVDLPKPTSDNAVAEVDAGRRQWRITLGWSREALRSAAHDLLLWYAGNLGDAILKAGGINPWPEMTNHEAGRNAIKQAFYYALDGRLSGEELPKAISLYNCLGFGYALGSAFRGSDGAAKMLWYEDLEEIVTNGVTRDGGYLQD